MRKSAEEIKLEISREQLWAKLADVWLCEIYLVTKEAIPASEVLIQVMANTLMGEFLAKGLVTHESMLEKFSGKS